MLNSILALDQKLTTIILQFLPRFDLFDFISSFFWESSWLIWLILALFVFFIIKTKQRFIFILVFTLALLSQGFFINTVLKNVFRRPRPCFTSQTTNYQLPATISCPIDFSFPSGHSASAFCAAAILNFFDRKRKWFYYSLAFSIALSRIYIFHHYLGDIIIGGLIGWLTTYLFLKLPKIPIVSKE